MATKHIPLSELFMFSIVIVQHCQELFLTDLFDFCVQLLPVNSRGLHFAVAAGEILQGETAKGDLGLPQEASAPVAQLFQFGQDQTSLPVGDEWVKREG